MDVVIRGGRVVTAAGEAVADVRIQDGTIVQVGGAVPGAPSEIDARGKYLLPGVVDIHTHFLAAGTRQRVDTFVSGSRAAAAGGVTTVCDFAYQADGEGLWPATERALAEARPSIVDYTFHIVLSDPSTTAIQDIDAVADAGFAGLKILMMVDSFAPRATQYLHSLRAAGKAGVVTAMHAEDNALTRFLTEELLAQNRRGPEWYPASRPPVTEEIAVRYALACAQVAEAPIYLVHLSSRGALAALRDGRAAGVSVFGETRPIYLYLTRCAYKLPKGEGAKYVGKPPLRDQADVDALWAALRSGDLDTVCTDHVGQTVAAKQGPGLTFETISPGMPNLETALPMLYSIGVREGRISMPRLVQLLSTNPARIAGLAPRKGSIQPGADADLVIFDPDVSRTVHASDMQSASDFDPFEGWEVVGWPSMTLSRGEIIYADRRVLGQPGRGRFVPRQRFGSAHVL
jgi:dihydropyrimidinase